MTAIGNIMNTAKFNSTTPAPNLDNNSGTEITKVDEEQGIRVKRKFSSEMLPIKR